MRNFESSMFKMPNGKYGGMCYYIPNKLFEEANGGGYKLSLPEEFEIKLKDGENDRTISLNVEEYLNEVKGKTAKDYETDLSKPSTFKRKFASGRGCKRNLQTCTNESRRCKNNEHSQ